LKEMRSFDLTVVGGGPAGLIAASEAARRGLSVLLLEEHGVVGRPERCAGLYSIRGLERIGVRLSRGYVQNLIWGASIRSPSGAEMEVEAANPVAVVAEREALDRFLADEAAGAGVKILLGTPVGRCGLDSYGRCRIVTEGGESYTSRVAVLAEGSSARLSRRLFNNSYAPYWMPILQLIVKGHGLDPRKAHVWLKPYLRDFFGYLVPIDEELGRVGVAGWRGLHERAARLIEEEMPRAKVVGYMSHSIYRGPPLGCGLTGRILLVGDAAGQVKATTGGGVVTGGICARAAGTHAYKLIAEGAETTYREMVRGLYRELRMIYWISRALSSITDTALDRLIRNASESGLAASLSARGDMDLQASGLFKSLLSPAGVRLLVQMAKGFF
jgi:digeranylgeranylglycerophospholipid reductase